MNRNSGTKDPIYLDYNATTPHDPEVILAMRPFLEQHFGNPSSSHPYGSITKNAVNNARQQVANGLNCQPDEIVFTSGGTESNNYAITGAAFAHRHKGNHIITSQIEHPAVTKVCEYLQENGFKITYLPVDKFGLVNIDDVKNAITSHTILITIMHANNEVGTVQPIEEISRIAQKHGIIFHTDAAQSVGKISTDVKILGIDLLSVAGHKLYAPKGIGALYIRRGTALKKFVHGAGHEQGRRAGTENVMEIVGLGKACEIAKRDWEKNILHMKNMSTALQNGLRKKINDIRLNGHPEKRLPNTQSLSFKGVEANKLIAEINHSLAVSAGAACHSDGVDVSHVLKAMNVPVEWAKGTIRFSTGKMTSPEEIEKTIEIMSAALFKINQLDKEK